MLFGYFQIDPFYIYLELYKTTFPNFLVVLRYFVLIILPNWAPVGTRTAIVLAFQTWLKFWIALTTIKGKQTLSKSTILLYKRLIIQRNILKPYETAIFVTYTPLSFLLLVGSFSFLLLGLKFRVPFEVFLTFLGIAIVTFGLTIPVYSTGCIIYIYSLKIIEHWKRLLEMQLKFDQKSALIMRKMIKALSPLTLPAGNMGIIDRDFMLNFFSALLQYTVNLMVVVRELVT